MSGTKAGARKAKQTIYERHGKNFYQCIGKIGGSKLGVQKGFALMTPERRALCGHKGGTISRRGKSCVK